MDIVTNDTRKHFLISAIGSFAIAAALHQWLMVLVVVWVGLIMSGVAPFLKNQKAISSLWGAFFGLTVALAVLLFTPFGAKLYAI